MGKRAAILMRTGPDDQERVGRFLAILCFIEFYSRFIPTGRGIWNAYFASPGENDWDYVDVWLSFLTAMSFLATSRALWRSSRGSRWWALLTLVLLAGLVVRAVNNPPWSAWLKDSMPTYIEIWDRPWSDLTYNLWPGLWITLMFLIWRNRSHRWLRSWRHVAIGWCVTLIFFSIIAAIPGSLARVYESGLALWLNGHAVKDFFPSLPPSIGSVVLVVPALTVLALSKRWRVAALLALLTAALEAAPLIEIGYSLAALTYRAIQALIASVPPSQNPSSWPGLLLNESTFQCWALGAVRVAAPWLLIVWFAWRPHLAELPDDGSPWPWRYCAKCFYNLHGVEAERCPECGSLLLTSVRILTQEIHTQ